MRLALFAIAGTMLASTGAPAQPIKAAAADPAKPGQSNATRAPIVLASVDPIRSSTDVGQPASTAVKRKVAPRVTTCRCGPPRVEPEAEPEDQ
jgi:hypothetical protein